MMFKELIDKTNGDFNNFPKIDDGTWPSVFDDFNVYWQKNTQQVDDDY